MGDEGSHRANIAFLLANCGYSTLTGAQHEQFSGERLIVVR